MLIALIGVCLLPDFSLCPKGLGENHHGSCKDDMMKHDESSKAEPETDSTAAFMAHKNCVKIQNAADYVISNQYTVKLSIKQITLIASIIPINYELPEQKFFITPEPRCNGRPPLPPNSLRGPPLV